MALSLYTVGYQGRTLPGLVELLREWGVNLVVDVRELPWSRKPGFSKAALAEGLRSGGIAYEHARFAGNPKALRAGARSHEDALRKFDRYLGRHPNVVVELDALFRRQPLGRQTIALLCFERHPADCHRSILLQHWRLANEDTTTPIVHLAPDGAPRFTSRTIAPAGSSTRDASGTTSQ